MVGRYGDSIPHTSKKLLMRNVPSPSGTIRVLPLDVCYGSRVKVNAWPSHGTSCLQTASLTPRTLARPDAHGNKHLIPGTLCLKGTAAIGGGGTADLF
jgi:hypothetical protein